MQINEWLKEDIAKDILVKKYFTENETLDEWFERVSGNNNIVKQAIIDKKFIFAGRILANRGTKSNTSYANCTVISTPEDSMESIFDSAKEMALVYKAGLGAGIDLSKLRGRGELVNNAAKYASGSVSFMELYNVITSIISQQGQNRQGALLIALDIFHKDILEFIKIKSTEDKIRFANISVKMFDKFMENLNDEENEKIWKALCENNWKWGDPGLLFFDKITSYNIVSEDENYEIIGTNACSEKPLRQGGTCNLCSINISAFVEEGQFNWSSFEKMCGMAVRAMNVIVDESMDRLPLQLHKDSLKDWRNLGIGIIGLADAFIKMEMTYASKESLEFSDKLMSTMANKCLQESALEAAKYGAYPCYKEDKILASPYIKAVSSEKTLSLIQKHGLRNCELLSIAPGGSISLLLDNASSGMEPHFLLSYNRTTKAIDGKDKIYSIDVPSLKEWKEKNNDKDIPEYFVTSMNIDPFEKLKLHSILQKYVDSSISATYNLRHEATEEYIGKLYVEAWKAGLKGLTVFRDNCYKTGILTDGTNEKAPCMPRSTKRPEILECDIHYSNMKNEKWIMFVGMFEDTPYEMIGGKLSENIIIPRKYRSGFIRKNGKVDGRQTYDLLLGDSLENEDDLLIIKDIAAVFSPDVAHSTRLISMLLRHNVGIHYIINQLKKMNPEAALFDFESVIRRILSKYLRDQKTDETCPQCGENAVIHQSSCETCTHCGWSRCS
jgi:ribonucleoside-diphosphate reductase alpha chain